MIKTEKQNWFSRNLGNIAPVKLLAGFAVGAMLITTVAMPGIGVSADEPSRPLGAASRSIPASADYQQFALWEFPDTRG